MNYLTTTRPRWRPLNFGNFAFGDLDRLFDCGVDEPSSRGRAPHVETREEDERYVVEAEVPGLSEKDVKVDVEDGQLAIATSVQEEKEGEAQELRGFSFRRVFSLPDEVEREKISAQFVNGVLKIDLPKKEKAKPKRISIKVE